MLKRDLAVRYRGSVIGAAWTLVTPLVLLAIYTFVFNNVLQTRWRAGPAASTPGSLDFALILFIGLMTYNYAVEVLNRAPTIIINNPNLVKRVVFPLQVFPLMTVSTALFQYCINILTFIVFYVATIGHAPIGALWLPLIVLPFTILLIGCAWLLAAVTVYFRDVVQVMGLASLALLFVSPVFYPAEQLPPALRPFFNLNPLTFIIEQSRAVVFFDATPNFVGIAAYAAIALVIALLGRLAFGRMRRGFADVL